ncbi:hypothetical protein ACP70R_048843 [Stipagrostis hirtigluma subsp. patula]
MGVMCCLAIESSSLLSNDAKTFGLVGVAVALFGGGFCCLPPNGIGGGCGEAGNAAAVCSRR